MIESSNVTVGNSGVGFFGALTLIFITLKLIDKIDWNWIWVLSPLWIPTCVVLFGILVVLIIAGVLCLVDN